MDDKVNFAKARDVSAVRDRTERRVAFPGFLLWRNELAGVHLSRPSRASTGFARMLRCPESDEL